MDASDLPDDLRDDVEIIYLDDGVEIEGIDDEGIDYEGINENEGFGDGNGMDEDEAEDVEDMAKLTFSKHQGSVFCSDVSKDGRTAVTGGEDDMAYIWRVEDGEVILECTGHKDSVSEVGFNYDGQLVVTADMGGLTQVWSLRDKKLIWCNEGDDMSWLFWHHAGNIILTGSKSGEVYIWQVPAGNCKVFPSHGSGCSSGKLLTDGKRLLAGYEDGMLKLWDIKNASALWQIDQPLLNEITALGVNDENTLAVLAPKGESFKIVDGKFIAYYSSPDDSEIESLLFNSELNAMVVGSLSGQLCVWDLGKNVIRHQAKLDSSVTILKWGKNGKVIAGTVKGTIYVCDVRSGTLCEILTGHLADVLSISVASDCSFILTTSDDRTAKIFPIKHE